MSDTEYNPNWRINFNIDINELRESMKKLNAMNNDNGFTREIPKFPDLKSAFYNWLKVNGYRSGIEGMNGPNQILMDNGSVVFNNNPESNSKIRGFGSSQKWLLDANIGHETPFDKESIIHLAKQLGENQRLRIKLFIALLNESYKNPCFAHPNPVFTLNNFRLSKSISLNLLKGK